MKKGKKVTVWILGSIAVLMLLAGSLILVGPRLIHTEFAKREIVNHLSRKIGGRVHIGQADFSFFPRPHVVILGAGVSVPGSVSADIRTLTVYPRVWPLCLGRIEITRIHAQSPAFTLCLPASNSRPEKPPGAPVEDLPNRLAALLGPAMAAVEGLSLQIQNGKINLVRGDNALPGIDHIDFLLQPSFEQITIELTGESSLCERISLKARIDPMARKVEGHIDLTGLTPRRLPACLIPHGPFGFGGGQTSLDLTFRANLSGGLQAEMDGSIPYFALVHEDKQAVFKGTRVVGAVSLKSGITTISVSRLHLDAPRLDLSGEMVMDSRNADVRLSLEAGEMDVASIRKTALTLGGTVPAVRKVFDIVRAGRVPMITINTRGKSPVKLFGTDHLEISGRIGGGRIFIAQTRMDLADVSGTVHISEGMLIGTGLEARLGTASGGNGSLKLGLTGHDPLFHLDIHVKADLKEALPVVERLIPDGPFRRELRRIDSIRGNAAARLILGGNTSSVRTRVEVSEFSLSARYRPIPYLLQARGGRISYENRVINAHQAAVSIGQSCFSGLSGMLNWHDESFLEMKAGTCTILLDEIHPWLASLHWTGDALRDLSSLKGSILVNALDFKGPLLKPGAWRFTVDGRIRDVDLISRQFPGTLNLRGGMVKADNETIAFEGARLSMLDARLSLSGRATGYLKGVESLQATVDGGMGEKGVRFASKVAGLPGPVRPRSPIAIREGRFAWNRGAETYFQGDLTVADGPRIALRGVRTPGLLQIHDLCITDETSHASFRFSRGRDAVGFAFSGNLTGTCLDSLLVRNRFMTGWIKGDLWGRLIPGRPIESTIEGHLKGGNIDLRQLDLPVRIHTFSIEGSQQQLRFISDIVALDDRQIDVEADIDLSEQGILLRLDLAADSIDLKRTKAALEKLAPASERGERQTRWSVPVRGTAHVRLGRLECGRWAWQPFSCDISSEGSTLHMAVGEAALCGISTPGTVEISPGKLALHVVPAARGRDLAATIDCLTGESIKISGMFELKGDITGEGTGETLVRSLSGPIHFVSKKGRIDRFNVLMQIFSLLNITEIFRGRLPDLRSQGFAYNSVTVDGRVNEGRLALTRALLDGSSMNIACTGHVDLLKETLELTVLAAPFKTADRIVRMLPVIGYILDNTLVSIAVRVTGDLKNPRVEYLPVSMLESGMRGIMERTLEAPVKVLTPMIPK